MASSVRSALDLLFRYGDVSDTPAGKGGCGYVWRAHDLLFDRAVAIKTISEFATWNLSNSARRSFIKEAQVGARLGNISRHIVKVNDFGVVDSVPYFVMEWIEPRDGQSWIDASHDMGRLSLAQVKALLFEISDAVSIAHNNGVVHSDIAPWNIVYDPTERVYKLCDFGLLKIVEENLVSHASGSLLVGGRVDFFPPTVRAGSEQISRASDVYALAVTLRVLLEGPGCLGFNGGNVTPTPGVITIQHAGRKDAPHQVRKLLLRFIDGHTPADNIQEFQEMLKRIPNT